MYQTASLIGGASSGFLEIFIFHPYDTIAKRLMANQFKFKKDSLNKIIFKETANESFIKKYASLYPGLKYGVMYKVLQRTYKFGFQPIVKELVDKVNPGNPVWNHAIAGGIVGGAELMLLPFDVLKIRAQTNPDSVRGSIMEIIVRENWQLFKGATWTVARFVFFFVY